MVGVLLLVTGCISHSYYMGTDMVFYLGGRGYVLWVVALTTTHTAHRTSV